MNRGVFSVFLVALFFLAAGALATLGRADDTKAKKDAQKKDSKDDDKSKDKKSDGVKRAETTGGTLVSGKIAKVDDATMSLELRGRKAKLDDIIIADDVKVRLPAEQEFDSKGKPKPFKPDPNDPDRKLGGVKGSKDDLREGQQVAVKIGKHKKDFVATVILVLPEEKK